ncbi:MAG: ribonuclease catalytic domain-containing protein [Saezia sp.]
MSQADASSQVELDSGRRVKVKSAHILLRFDAPSPAELMTQAQALSEEIDLDLAWEFAPGDEFGFADFAKDYYDKSAGIVQQVASLLALFGAPHYFRRSGKGRFKKAPEESVKAALLGIERKQQQQAQIDAWAQELVEGVCAEPVKAQLYKILFKPDKNALEYKAVVQASRQSQVSVLDLFKRAGAISSAYQFHWQRFLFEFFPKGTGFEAVEFKADKKKLSGLPVAQVQAFSIDDAATTEIDDALSIQGLGSGTVTLGVHISAPGLGITADDVIDEMSRRRLSTVYMPGWKIPMLPPNVVEIFTLEQGRECPALSLYVSYDEATFEVRDVQTRLELLTVAENIRYDLVEDVLNEATLAGDAPMNHAFGSELMFLYQLAKHLKAGREEVRGKPETFARPDYHFHVLDDKGTPLGMEPTGQEKVSISERKRGSALDLIVSEAMIVANSVWGGLLASSKVPGIYRSQAALRPGIKVRMGTKALPHAGLGVAQYVWSTSPLRRYVDLVNQWQIIACVQNGAAAALLAPFKAKDAALFSIISAFESTYSGYADFQRGMERYWVLRYLQQNNMTELEAVVMKNGMVRALSLPLVCVALGVQNHAKDTVVLIKINHLDELTLDVGAQFVKVIEDVGNSPSGAPDDVSEDDEEEQEVAGPIVLAVDVGEEEGAVSDVPRGED